MVAYFDCFNKYLSLVYNAKLVCPNRKPFCYKSFKCSTLAFHTTVAWVEPTQNVK